MALSRLPTRPLPRPAVGPRPSELLTAFFSAALILIALAAAAAIAYAATGDWRLRWLALHLALLGGVSQLVLGASQFFVCAFLATSPPARRLVAVQLLLWNAGVIAVAIGVPTGTTPLIDAGGILLAGGLVMLAVSMRAMERRSLQRARWAVRWYQASAACLGVGTLVGVLLARGVGWIDGSLVGTHLALNIGGWLGMAIIGTLHTFFPSLTGTKPRFPHLQAPTFVLWLLGVIELAIAAALAVDVLAAIAWAELTAAGGLLAANLIGSLRQRTIPLALTVRLVALAQVFLPAGLALALVATLANGAAGPLLPSVRPALAILLLAGWIALTVAGSLLHLLRVLARVRDFTVGMPAPHPPRDRIVTALAAVAVIAWALAQVPGLGALDLPALVLRLVAIVVLVSHIAAAAARAGVPALRVRRSDPPSLPAR